MKQYAVIHCQKGKGSGGGQGYHIDRDTEHAHTFGQVDPTRRILNREFAPDKFTQLSMPEAIAVRIKEGYTSNRAIRADTVRYVDTIMSGSHEQMKELEKNGQITEWAKQSQKLAEDMFGKENIVRFTLHMDERTPHIHCVFVPITEDGRLSAKEILSRKNLSLVQDRYGEMMKPFGFERGEKGSLAVHDTPKEYYGRVVQTNKEIENLVVKGLLGTDWKKTAENAINALKSIKTTEKSNEYKLDRIEKRVGFKLEAENGRLKQRNENLEKDIEKKEKYIKALNNFITNSLNDPSILEIEKERRAKAREELQLKKVAEEAKIQQRNSRGKGRGI
jgi:hypothetical protein